MNDLLTTTHARTTTQDIHETTRQLVGQLGVTAVSYLAGAKDAKQAAKWQRADGPEPRLPARRRLMAAHRAWQLLATSENDYVARNWFVGANPRLEELSPLEALRSGQISQVMDAATAFREGTDG
jgi:hypothetical protein